jgi:hypothetical protein
VGAGAARGQGFGDYETAGRSEDVRREASPLSVGGHSLQPTIDWKLFGVVTPHVFGAAGFGYTSNLLRGDEEVRGAVLEDEYFRGELGARLDTLLGDHRIELDGRARFTEYLESGDYDTAEGRASARLDLLFTDVEVHGDLSWSRTAYPQTQQLTGIVRLDTYRAGLWVEARVGRFGVRVGAWALRPDYVDRDLEDLDYTSLGGDLQVYGRILPKLRGLVEYAYSRLLYDEGDQGTLDDYDLHRVATGIDGELTEKLTASLKLGASFQDVRSDVNADTREFRGFTAACSVRWQPLPHTTLDGGWSRSIDPSVNSNYLLSDAFHLGITQQLWEERISLSARGGYSHGAVKPGRHLNTFSAGASASWQVRDWLSVRAVYAFQRLNSAFTLAEAAVSDYTVHEAELSLGIGF